MRFFLLFSIIILSFGCDHSHVDVGEPEVSIDPWTPSRPGISSANDMIPLDLVRDTGDGDLTHTNNDVNNDPDPDGGGRQPVPEPSTMLMMGAGLLFIGLIKKKKNQPEIE